jgi:hypothetical protein
MSDLRLSELGLGRNSRGNYRPTNDPKNKNIESFHKNHTELLDQAD